MVEEDGHTAALRTLKMCFETESGKPDLTGLIEAVKDAAKTENPFNKQFLNTVLVFAAEGWKDA